MTEDEMVGWHHRLGGHEFEQALGAGNGQGGLVCHSPWDCKESDMTERKCSYTHTRQEEKGMTEAETVGWHHQLDGHEFEQALGAGNGQESPACYSP